MTALPNQQLSNWEKPVKQLSQEYSGRRSNDFDKWTQGSEVPTKLNMC